MLLLNNSPYEVTASIYAGLNIKVGYNRQASRHLDSREILCQVRGSPILKGNR